MKKIIACLAILSSLSVFSLPMYADTNTTSSDQETNTTVSENQNGTMPGQDEDTNGTMPGQGENQNGTMPGQGEDQNGTMPGQGENQNGTMPGQGEDQNGTMPGQGENQNGTMPGQGEDQNGTMPGQGEDQNGTMPGQGEDQNGTIPGQGENTNGTIPGQGEDTNGTMPGQGEDQNGTMPGQGENQNGTLPGQDTCPPNTTCNIETPQLVDTPPQDFPIKQSNNANAEMKVFKAKVGDKEATIGLEIKSESSTQTSQTKPEIKSVQVIEPNKKTIEIENKKITIPFGLLSYTIDVDQGATVEITLVFPRDDRINGYMKYIDGKWKNVPIQKIRHERAYTLITLSLTDGGEFDDDGSANGSITDPGGPVVLPQTVQVPMSKSALLLLALLLALLPFARRKIS